MSGTGSSPSASPIETASASSERISFPSEVPSAVSGYFVGERSQIETYRERAASYRGPEMLGGFSVDEIAEVNRGTQPREIKLRHIDSKLGRVDAVIDGLQRGDYTPADRYIYEKQEPLTQEAFRAHERLSARAGTVYSQEQERQYTDLQTRLGLNIRAQAEVRKIQDPGVQTIASEALRAAYQQDNATLAMNPRYVDNHQLTTLNAQIEGLQSIRNRLPIKRG